MPQRFMTKFSKMSIQGNKRRNYKKSSTDSDSDDSDTEDVDLYSPEVLSLVTRSGPIILKRHKMFEEIFERGLPAQNNTIDCIMACGKERNTVLYPCKHMLMCTACWFLLKTYELKKQKNITFENDVSDNVTKPKCPLCRQVVDETDEIRL